MFGSEVRDLQDPFSLKDFRAVVFLLSVSRLLQNLRGGWVG